MTIFTDGITRELPVFQASTLNDLAYSATGPTMLDDFL